MGFKPRSGGIQVGYRIRTRDGRNGPVTWVGPNKYGPGIRVGFRHEGDTHWVSGEEIAYPRVWTAPNDGIDRELLAEIVEGFYGITSTPPMDMLSEAGHDYFEQWVETNYPGFTEDAFDLDAFFMDEHGLRGASGFFRELPQKHLRALLSNMEETVRRWNGSSETLADIQKLRAKL